MVLAEAAVSAAVRGVPLPRVVLQVMSRSGVVAERGAWAVVRAVRARLLNGLFVRLSELGLAGFRPLKLNVEKPLSVFVKYRERV